MYRGGFGGFVAHLWASGAAGSDSSSILPHCSCTWLGWGCSPWGATCCIPSTATPVSPEVTPLWLFQPDPSYTAIRWGLLRTSTVSWHHLSVGEKRLNGNRLKIWLADNLALFQNLSFAWCSHLASIRPEFRATVKAEALETEKSSQLPIHRDATMLYRRAKYTHKPHSSATCTRQSSTLKVFMVLPLFAAQWGRACSKDGDVCPASPLLEKWCDS